MNPTVLGPAWQFRPVDEFTHGFYPVTETDWFDQTLPAHWQEHPDLTQHTGNVVYRYCFNQPRAPNLKAVTGCAPMASSIGHRYTSTVGLCPPRRLFRAAGA